MSSAPVLDYPVKTAVSLNASLTVAPNVIPGLNIPGLTRESDRLKLLLDMTNALVSNLEPRDLLRAISASIRQVMHCDLVGVWLPDVDQRQLRLRFLDFPESRGFAEEDSVYPIEGTTLGRVFTTGSR